MAALNTDKFRKVVAQWTGTIGSAGVNDAVVTTIPLASVSNIPTTTAVMITVNRVTALGAKTNNYEGIVGVVSGNNLINCLRGVEGTAQAWVAGTVVEILATADNTNDLIDGLLVEHSQLGVHDVTKVVNLTTAQTLTNKTLTSPKINENVALTATATQLNVLAGVMFKVGEISRDIATASGTQAVTGVGFQPKYIEFRGNIDAGIQSFHGVSDGTTAKCLYSPDFAASPTAGKFQLDISNVITIIISNSVYYTGTVAFNADGFTITWTKTGSPTGVATIIYTCYR